MSAAADYSGKKEVTKNTKVKADGEKAKKTYETDLSFLDGLPSIKKPKKKTVLEEHLAFLENFHKTQSSKEDKQESNSNAETQANTDPILVRFESINELLTDSVDQVTKISEPKELLKNVPEKVKPAPKAEKKKPVNRKPRKKSAAQIQKEEKVRQEKERAAAKKAEIERRHREAREREERLAREAEEARNNKKSIKKSLFGKLVAN